jgi:hypothetical protein
MARLTYCVFDCASDVLQIARFVPCSPFDTHCLPKRIPTTLQLICREANPFMVIP